MAENHHGNRRQFKEFEMWRDHFSLAELIENGQLTVKLQGEENCHQSFSIPAEQPERNQLKRKQKRKQKLCFAHPPYLRSQCAFCKSFHHFLWGPCGETMCATPTCICPICQATGDKHPAPDMFSLSVPGIKSH